MTITKMGWNPAGSCQQYLVECDEIGCKRHLEFRECEHWNDMIKGVQRAGWQIKKVFSSFHHYCERHHRP